MRNVYPQPDFVEADMVALLASRQFIFADCYTVTLITDEVMRWSTAQQNVDVFPIGDDLLVRTYSSNGVLVQGLTFKLGIGVEVDEQTITMVYKDTDVIPDREVSVAQGLRRGDFDGATIVRDRYYAPSWGEPWVGGVRLFSGQVGSLEGVGRTEGKMKVRSDLALLNVPMPRNLYQPSCVHTVFDSGCKLVKGDYATIDTVEAGSTTTRINWTGAGAITPPLKLGTIYIANQENVMFSRTIRDVTANQLVLSFPLDFLPETGMQFTVFPGCPRTLAACDVFANRENFKGFPFVPVAETAY